MVYHCHKDKKKKKTEKEKEKEKAFVSDCVALARVAL
jgi:hypothetical protein